MKLPIRIISLEEYKVIESMVKDGLISGLPYSEGTQYEEFLKRLSEVKTNGPESIKKLALEAWLPAEDSEPFFSTDRNAPLPPREYTKLSLWQRIKNAYNAFMED